MRPRCAGFPAGMDTVSAEGRREPHEVLRCSHAAHHQRRPHLPRSRLDRCQRRAMEAADNDPVALCARGDHLADGDSATGSLTSTSRPIPTRSAQASRSARTNDARVLASISAATESATRWSPRSGRGESPVRRHAWPARRIRSRRPRRRAPLRRPPSCSPHAPRCCRDGRRRGYTGHGLPIRQAPRTVDRTTSFTGTVMVPCGDCGFPRRRMTSITRR